MSREQGWLSSGGHTVAVIPSEQPPPMPHPTTSWWYTQVKVLVNVLAKPNHEDYHIDMSRLALD